MFARDILKEVDRDAVSLHDGVFATRIHCCNSKSQLVFIECEGRFEAGGRQLRRDPQQASHESTSFVRGPIRRRKLTINPAEWEDGCLRATRGQLVGIMLPLGDATARIL